MTTELFHVDRERQRNTKMLIVSSQNCFTNAPKIKVLKTPLCKDYVLSISNTLVNFYGTNI
jgi:hypothetical protein